MQACTLSCLNERAPESVLGRCPYVATCYSLFSSFRRHFLRCCSLCCLHRHRCCHPHPGCYSCLRALAPHPALQRTAALRGCAALQPPRLRHVFQDMLLDGQSPSPEAAHRNAAHCASPCREPQHRRRQRQDGRETGLETGKVRFASQRQAPLHMTLLKHPDPNVSRAMTAPWHPAPPARRGARAPPLHACPTHPGTRPAHWCRRLQRGEQRPGPRLPARQRHAEKPLPRRSAHSPSGRRPEGWRCG